MKRNVDLRAIIMSLFGLTAIIVIMMQLQRSLPKAPDVLVKFPQKERIGIVDSTYINRPFSFMWTMPNSQWQLKTETMDTLLSSPASNQSISSQIHWLASAQRFREANAVAECKVGAFLNPAKKTCKDTAVNLLAEMLRNYERDGARASILQPVRSPAHQTLGGAYFVFLAPSINKPVQVVALLPRANNVFIILSETTEEDYPLLRDELQKLIEKFYPLPRWKE